MKFLRVGFAASALALVSILSFDSRAAEFISHAGEAETVLYVVPFDGPEALAKNVTKIVGLQVWEAIDKLPRPSAEALASGQVSLVWGTDPLPRHSYSAAEEAARHALGQRNMLVELVLWGKVYEYGEGAIVQVHLSIPDYKAFGKKRGAFWPDRFPQPHPDDNVKSEVLSADIPQRRYSFDPIILAREVAARYSSPDALERYAAEGSDAVDRTGGVRLPETFLIRREAAIFVSALVQIFRSNWASAEMLMGKVADNQNTPNDVKTDALLYKAFAQLQQRKPATETLAAARKLSPYAKRVVMYSFLGELAENDNQLAANPNDPKRGEALSRLSNLLNENRHLFAQSDPWFDTASSTVTVPKEADFSVAAGHETSGPSSSKGGEYGTPDEARAMLERAVAELKADKAKALAMFNERSEGFGDRDLYVYCGGPDGNFTAHYNEKLRGASLKELKDKAGKDFGEEIHAVAEPGKLVKVEYKWTRPGSEEVIDKVAYVTKEGDEICAVGYYK